MRPLLATFSLFDQNVSEHINHDGLPGAGLNAWRHFFQMSGLPSELGGTFINEFHDTALGPYKDLGKAKLTVKQSSFDKFYKI
jgi:hypothetical protein